MLFDSRQHANLRLVITRLRTVVDRDTKDRSDGAFADDADFGDQGLDRVLGGGRTAVGDGVVDVITHRAEFLLRRGGVRCL